MLLDCSVSLSWGATYGLDASLIQDIAFSRERLCTARSAQALVPHQLTQDAGGAGFLGALGFNFPGEVVGQFDYTVALRLVGVVVGHVQGEVGEHLGAVHVLHQLHHGVEGGAQD